MLIREPDQALPTTGAAQQKLRGLPQASCLGQKKGFWGTVPTLQAQLPGFKSRPCHFTVSKFSSYLLNDAFDKNTYQVSQWWWLKQLMWIKLPEPGLPWRVWIKLLGPTPSPICPGDPCLQDKETSVRLIQVMPPSTCKPGWKSYFSRVLFLHI